MSVRFKTILVVALLETVMLAIVVASAIFLSANTQSQLRQKQTRIETYEVQNPAPLSGAAAGDAQPGLQSGLEVARLRAAPEEPQKQSWVVVSAAAIFAGLFSFALGAYLMNRLRRIPSGTQTLNHVDVNTHTPMGATRISESRHKTVDPRQDIQSQFIATISHEIRTPLNGIMGMAQLLNRPEVTDKRRREWAGIILQSGGALLDQLNDILDFSKLETGKLTLDPHQFCMIDLLNESLSTFGEQAATKGLDWEVNWQGPADAVYQGDPIRLRQMLAHLASNAVKFTPSGSVRIVAQELSRQKDLAEISIEVRDTGIGVPAGMQDALFQPFTQAENSTARRYGGAGLGLSIVRGLAELMGIQLGIRANTPSGTVFWMHLTLACRTEGAAAKSTPEARAYPGMPNWHGKPLVLVVKGDRLSQQIVSGMLQPLGVQVRCVDDGAQALLAFTEGSGPDLVLMGLQMPVMSGYAATRAIRQLESLQVPPKKRTPILAITADAIDKVGEDCLRAGMDGMLAKPLAIYALVEQLIKHLGRPQAEIAAVQVPSKEDAEQLLAADRLIVQRSFDALAFVEKLRQNLPQGQWAQGLDAVVAQLKQMQFEAAHRQLEQLIKQHQLTVTS